MQQNSYLCSRGFFFCDLYTFEPQRMYRFLHQVHRPQRVTETAVLGSRIDEKRQSQLTNTAQTLHIRMLQHVVNQLVGNGQESEHRIVDYFAFICHFL